jgi:hypothetical protein
MARLKTRAFNIYEPAAPRALMHSGARPTYEAEPLAGPFTLVGFPLFGKFRSAVRKPRS